MLMTIRLEFSREWNIPVHHFLRRHVYGASRPYVSRNTATLITFLVSALGHELVMGCITKKLRGYGFAAQMSQLPIVAVQRIRIVRSRKLLNVSVPTYIITFQVSGHIADYDLEHPILVFHDPRSLYGKATYALGSCP